MSNWMFSHPSLSRSSRMWRPKKGRNIVRVFTYQHVITKADIMLKRYTEAHAKLAGVDTPMDLVGRPVTELFCPVRVHFVERRSVPCAMENCKYCREDIPARDQFLINVMDMNAEDAVVCYYPAPLSIITSIRALITDPDLKNEEIFGVKGRDLIILYNPDESPVNMYKVQLRDRAKSAKLNAKYEEQVLDLHLLRSFIPKWAQEYLDVGSAEQTPEPEPSPEPEEASKPQDPETDDVDLLF